MFRYPFFLAILTPLIVLSCAQGGSDVDAWTALVVVGVFGLVVTAAALLLRVTRERDRSLRRAKAQASEAKFAGIVSIAADAIITLDAEHRITIFNDGAEHIFGYTRDEVLGGKLDRMIPERFRAAHGQHLARFAEGPTIARKMGERREIYGLRKNGEEFPADAAISTLAVDGERLLTVVLRDVTERHREETRQRLLADAGSALASSLDVGETLEQVAKLATRSLSDLCVVALADEANPGCPAAIKAAASSSRFGALPVTLEATPASTPCPFLQGRLTKADPMLVDHMVLAPSGMPGLGPAEQKTLEALSGASMMAVPLIARARHIGAMVLVRDGTPYADADLAFLEKLAQLAALAVDNARLYRAATEALKGRDDVLGIVAHDLRSPLNGMLLNLQVLRRKLARAEVSGLAEGLILDLHGSALAMNRLIQDLLDIARMEAGRLSLVRTPCAPGQLLEQARSQAAPMLGPVTLRIEPADALPLVWADEARVMQVFSNLIGNAVKFAGDGCVVAISAQASGAHVVFCVTDDGPGIAPEQLKHLWDRFWQADSADRRGAGLGLSIVKAIVELHGGEIRAESAVGRGSTFSFSLPLAPAA